MAQCFPTRPPINPLRLASNYRDYFGDAHAALSELTDPLLSAGCYVPQIVHAPDTPRELAGVAANDVLDYALVLPAGGWILGFLHTYTAAASANGTDPPVASSFRFQITDVDRAYRLFTEPVPEAWLLNDSPSSNAQAPIGTGLLTVLNPSPRLLPAPYPITAPGLFKLEFWNMLNALNTGVRLSLVLAAPDPDL